MRPPNFLFFSPSFLLSIPRQRPQIFFTAPSSFPAHVIAPNSVYIIGSGFVPDGIIAGVAAGTSQWWVVTVAARHFRFSFRVFVEDV